MNDNSGKTVLKQALDEMQTAHSDLWQARDQYREALRKHQDIQATVTEALAQQGYFSLLRPDMTAIRRHLKNI